MKGYCTLAHKLLSCHLAVVRTGHETQQPSRSKINFNPNVYRFFDIVT